MPLSYSISSISALCTPPERYTIQEDDPYQQHSTISQDAQIIAFSTEPPTALPMTDSNKQPINARDLTSRLRSLEQNQQHTTNSINTNNNINEEAPSSTPYPPTMSQRRPRPSLDITTLPRITKSATTSTTCTSSTQASLFSHGLRAEPSARTHAENVGVARGDFSKPRVHQRSRRDTHSSSRSEEGMAFKYYGRHSNQWLFNDFSVTDAVSKGWRRVFGREGEGKDWYEDREK